MLACQEMLDSASEESSMRVSNAPTAAHIAQLQHGDDDRDQAEAAGQSSAQTGRRGAGRQDASGSQNSGRAQRLMVRGGPGPRRWVCSMYKLPTYFRTDLCSPASLGIANSIMQACTLPGLHLGSFLLVSRSSLLFHLGTSWGFTAMTIALGSSYFQRLCHVMPSLQWAAQRHASFAAYAAPRLTDSDDDDDDPGLGYVNSPAHQSRDLTLRSVLFTCVSVASKYVDRCRHPGILQFMLSKIYGVPVNAEHVYDMESKCLDGLDWRLGPYFLCDDLRNNWVAWILE